jgi:hypothetical protein
MSRIAVVLLVAAGLSMAPGLALGADEPESSSQTSAAQSEELEDCAVRSETASNQPLQVEEMPIYIPPNRGSALTRIGGATRGGLRPLRRT